MQSAPAAAETTSLKSGYFCEGSTATGKPNAKQVARDTLFKGLGR